ncbi:MAG: hypothetical protein A3H98_07450 [Bacteroidetes bacterium RIFCSPLOWO2_02_FULL_36_8]|nr:MAG: hypothetical protein A3H98_07450 [Bacteroidetes bacterium RIFCSPLOWO2_02_FULL_36_8]OFY69892.1 MAG: hypothetical protein A3G23_05365 [Bacteroidetes bacterium RIFCSPLOWO2_12_FULL_37_12]
MLSEGFSQSKTLKIGYTNVDYILSLMPESKKIESDIKVYKTQLENQAKEKLKEYQEKLEAYQKGAEMMTDVIKSSKERELMNLQQEIQMFQKDAEESLAKKQQESLEPLLDKIQKAIDAVAQKNDITYVFNSDAGFGSTPILLHGPKEDNVSDLILREMGITPPTVDKKEEKGGTKGSKTGEKGGK